MALILPAELPFGTCQSAYHRIDRVAIDANLERAEIHLCSYMDEESRQSGAQPIRECSIHASGDYYEKLFAAEALDSLNPFAAGYYYLKMLPEFLEAKDA